MTDRKAIRKLDALFSQYIRMRAMARVGGCERCLTRKESWKQLQCSHFWGRARYSIRWDEDDAIGACGACHMYLASHPEEHRQFFLERLGQVGYDMLEYRAHRRGDLDLRALEIYLRQKIEGLKED